VLTRSTSATRFHTGFLGVFDVGHHFQQRWDFTSNSGSVHTSVSRSDRVDNVDGGSTRATSNDRVDWDWLLSFTFWFVTDQFTFWSWAQSWFLTFPVTFGFLAHRSTFWFGGDTRRSAVGRRAHGFTFRTSVFFTQILGASHVTFWFVTVYFAFGTFGLFTVNLALWSFTDRVALSRAHRVITLPTTFRVTLGGGFGCESNVEECQGNYGYEDVFHS